MIALHIALTLAAGLWTLRELAEWKREGVAALDRRDSVDVPA